MTRFRDVVGYGEPEENPKGSGKWVNTMTEIVYSGEVIRNTRTLSEAQFKLNDDITAANMISILADEHALKHFSKIKYVKWGEVYWTVPSVEVRIPRLILTLGGVYNGPTA